MTLRIAVTGHRPKYLGGYSETIDRRLLALAKTALTKIAQSHPDLLVYTGMAQGWDQAIAQAADHLGIPYIAVVPFAGLEDTWPTEARQHYEQLLWRAREVVYIGEPGYALEKYQARDAYLLDHADVILALWNGSRKTGTGRVMREARARGIKVWNLWASWQQHGPTVTKQPLPAASEHPVLHQPNSITEAPSPRVTIYVDGSCLGNPGPGGWGVVLQVGKHEKLLSGTLAETTNNRAELMAAILGLEALRCPCRVKLYTDSSYLKTIVEGGNAQTNLDLVEAIRTLTTIHQVEVMQVHRQRVVVAHELARSAAERAKRE